VLKARLESELRTGQSVAREEAPVGQSRRDLGWAAEQFRERECRPVFEDFHNLDSAEQRHMAFAIKALGEWEVPCVVAGIWPNNHLLTYCNGELDGRIEDLHVRWSGAELEEVLTRGCSALNVEMVDRLRRQSVRDAHTSVGLLQQLVYRVLWEAGVRRRRLRRRVVSSEDVYARGRREVITEIAGRFDPFADNFPKGAEGEDSPIFRHILWAVVERMSDSDLLEGVKIPALTRELTIIESAIDEAQVLAAVERLAEVQRFHQIQPAVLAYDPVREQLVLADRRFLLYRQHSERVWSWT
jgi:hypothetical protein